MSWAGEMYIDIANYDLQRMSYLYLLWFFNFYICEVIEPADWVLFHFVFPIHATILSRIPFSLGLLYKTGCLRNRVGLLQNFSLKYCHLMGLSKCPFSVVEHTFPGNPQSLLSFSLLESYEELVQYWDMMGLVKGIQGRLLKHHILIFFFYFRVSIGFWFYCCYELPCVVF